MSEFPPSIHEINNLPEPDKRAIYTSLVPAWITEQFTLSSLDADSAATDNNLSFVYLPGTRSLELFLNSPPSTDDKQRDPIFYLHMTDTFNNQILVLLAVVNDPNSARFNTDVDINGNSTYLGTQGRNIEAEKLALKAGLAPGQVRQGLRVFRSLVPTFESFVAKMGHDIFFIEPLAYHNAIVFEKFGFNYVSGLQRMHQIHEGFRPNGALYSKLTDENIFRKVAYSQSVRGRSWAIHDGILGEPFTGFQMYKRIGVDAGICTFPNGIWDFT